ncbi:MAG: gliding motility-associated C-terminal domain-containing protein [Bacteroidia bacterium]|nr:gliding motility-associated C-terminal domain-containing protein [Bacteroidia bacterium]
MKKVYIYNLVGISLIMGYITAQNNALYLNGAYIYMNGGTSATPIYLTINQPNTAGIVRTAGHIHSENQYNYVKWITGTNTGSYVIPFGVGGNATDYIPLFFNKTNAANVTLTVSTYSTNAANTPMPGASTSNGSGVAAVSSIPQSANAIDRYWDIKTDAAVNADITFSYRGSENTISGTGYCQTDTIKAQNWNGTSWNPLKGPGNPGVTSGIGTVGPIPFTSYAQFVLASVPITPSITSSQSVACNGASTGAATISTYGGLGPYSYNWSPSGGTSNVATGLSAGNYTVTVTGSNGCNRTATINISQPPAISLTVNSTSVNCTSLASATAIASGGTPTYNYTWSPGSITTNTINNLNIGNYTITVKDNNNCISSFTTSITGNTTAPTVAASASGSLNCTTNTVQITTNVTPSSGISYNWSGPGIVSGGSTGTIVVNQGGTYQVTVTNTANNCTATTSQSVAMDNNVPSIQANVSNSLNCTVTSAQISTTVSPSGTYTYNWSGPGIVSGSSTGTVTVNQGGVYQVTVTNTANSCTTTISQSVTQNTTAPNVTASASGSLNCTTNTVQITTNVTPSSGISYNWSGPGIVSGSGTGTIVVNQSGTYQVTVTNTANNCTATTSQAITQNTTAPNVTASVSGSLNCTTNTVQITTNVTPSSGISYNWSGPGIVSGGSTGTIVVNQGGTYQVTVMNTANNCTATTSQSVAMDNNVPSIQANVSNSLNCTVTSAQISTTVSPSGTYTYNWSGPGIVSGSSTGTVTVNQGGVYQVTVTNTANSCTVSITQSVTQNTTAPTVAASSTGTLDCNNATIQITSTVNPTSVTYSWMPSSGIVSGQGTGTITVNQPNTYTLIVTDAVNTCTSATTANITQNTVAPVVSAGSNQTLTCSSPSVQLIGSSSPSTGVTVSWLGGVCGSTNSFTTDACAAGTYTLVVTDNTNGCSSSSTVQVIPDVNLPSISATPSGSLNCTTNSVQIVASTTVSPVTYTWSGGGIVSGNGTATITVNQGGVYQLTVTNTSNGCSTSTVISVTENTTAPTVAASSTGTLDCNNATIQITSTVNPTFVTYSWIPSSGIVSGQGTGTITVNQPNTYTLIVTDAINTCTSVTTANITQNTVAPVITAGTNPTLTCASTSVSIGASSNPNTNVSVNWTGPNVCGATNTFTTSACAAGTYTIVVTDNTNGCSSSATIAVIPDANIPVVTANSSGSITCNNPTVQIAATTTASPVSYTWNGSGVVSGSNTSTAVVNQSGTYTVVVMNTSNGCIATQTVNVAIDTNSPSVSLSASSQSISCTNGTVDISVSPANSTYSYNWNGAGTFSGQGTATISTTNSGTYQVVVTNTINGCSTTQNINIGFNNNLVLNITGNTAVCQGSNINLNASGANTYTWTDGTNTYTTSFVNIPATSSVTFVVTGSSGSCTNTQTITVNVTPSVNVNVSSIPNNSINIGDQVQLNASGASSYTWTPITGLSCANCSNPIANPVVTTDYCVTGISTNGVCSDSACIRIYVDDRCPELFVPNVFSPNGDTKNDKLCIKGTKCVKEFQIVIFDRWGEKVYESTDKDACWDGTYNGKDMSGATFVYYIKGLTFKNELIDKKGNITIVK